MNPTGQTLAGSLFWLAVAIIVVIAAERWMTPAEAASIFRDIIIIQAILSTIQRHLKP